MVLSGWYHGLGMVFDVKLVLQWFYNSFERVPPLFYSGFEQFLFFLIFFSWHFGTGVVEELYTFRWPTSSM